MNLNEAKQILFKGLKELYEEREASLITEIVLEHVTGQSRSERLTRPTQELSGSEQAKLEKIFALLMQHVPVQYATGEAWFYKRKFKVAPGVLIPRPETEELVERVIRDFHNHSGIKILDIGTGSGNIPITLALELNAIVYSCDISHEAIAIAGENNLNFRSGVRFIHADVLDEADWEKLPEADVIISNPPYVSLEEKSSLEKHVVAYEPHIAIFPPGEDPLLFYRKIAALGKCKLTDKGSIYVEINSMLGKETLNVFTDAGYAAELIKDIYGNDRIIKARK